jgi:hypothetical protein
MVLAAGVHAGRRMTLSKTIKIGKEKLPLFYRTLPHGRVFDSGYKINTSDTAQDGDRENHNYNNKRASSKREFQRENLLPFYKEISVRTEKFRRLFLYKNRANFPSSSLFSLRSTALLSTTLEINVGSFELHPK